MPDDNDIKEAVRERYAGAATQGTSCCGPAAGGAGCGCSTGATSVVGGTIDRTRLGYSADDLGAIPEGADLGLGCGNPLAMLELRRRRDGARPRQRRRHRLLHRRQARGSERARSSAWT